MTVKSYVIVEFRTHYPWFSKNYLKSTFHEFRLHSHAEKNCLLENLMQFFPLFVGKIKVKKMKKTIDTRFY